MSLATVYSRAKVGIVAPLVSVEAHISRGLSRFILVGLPAAAVSESRDRVRSALLTSSFDFPRGRITVNLAPADLPKEGGRFDLPIALGILAASRQIPPRSILGHEFIGELALSGELRSVQGILPMVLEAQKAGRTLIIPAGNALEAALVKEAKVFYAEHLLEVCAYLRGEEALKPCLRAESDGYAFEARVDLAEVKGQVQAKKALEVAAAGKHSLLFIGPPGTGKTMLASRLPTLLPLLNEEQGLEVAAVASIAGQAFKAGQWLQIPFRAPHHSASAAALVGGGRPPRPGEISLAHQGVLFLDELPEFSRPVIEALREPLEAGVITISRAAFQTVFPARFQMVAAMNPCPCGYFGDARRQCLCSQDQIHRYRAKLSGPFLDRLDMQVEVPALPPELLVKLDQQSAESSSQVRERVFAARERQQQRQGKSNAELTVAEIKLYCLMESECEALMEKIMQKFQFSARVYHRLLKVARTLADLKGVAKIGPTDISEALFYRCLDKRS